MRDFGGSLGLIEALLRLLGTIEYIYIYIYICIYIRVIAGVPSLGVPPYTP